ncbi:MAG: MGMT family protein [Clostridia bacterium]|nr:MGMT family protein [Clostridia bacterium]
MFEKIYEAVKKIPKGRVATYGQIAAMIGSPKASRVVGYALHVNPEPGVIPCHRVVNRFGELAPAFAFGGREVQRAMLESEGVEVSDSFTVDLGEFLWR